MKETGQMKGRLSSHPSGRRSLNSTKKLQGGMVGRDRIGEALIAPNCRVCGQTILRPQQKRCAQNMQAWLKRKTCPGTYDKLGHYSRSKCWLEYHRGETNPNYKGVMPKCKDCNKKISYFCLDAKPTERCKECFIKWGHASGYFIQHAEDAVVPYMTKRKGIVPPTLIKYTFKNGRKAHNKVFDSCQIKGCNKKHLAKGKCSLHYYRKTKTD